MNYLIKQLLTQLNQLDSKMKVIYIHPNFDLCKPLFAEIKNQSIYFSLQGEQVTYEQLQEQYQTFAEGGPKLTAKTILIIDETDRAIEADLLRFLHDLLAKFRGRIMLAGRTTLTGLFADEHLNALTAVLPIHDQTLFRDLSQDVNSSEHIVEVHSFGVGRCFINGKEITSWDGILPRALFFYFIDRGMVSRDEIFQVFWPQFSASEATNVFHVTKRKIKDILGFELTSYGTSLYYIASNIRLIYDVSIFTKNISDLDMVIDEKEYFEASQQIMTLYKGDFLSELDMPWVVRRRNDLRQNYCEMLVQVAKYYEAHGEKERALTRYLQALSSNVCREDLTLSVMKLYQHFGMKADALSIYARLERELNDTLGVVPARQLQDFATSLKA